MRRIILLLLYDGRTIVELGKGRYVQKEKNYPERVIETSNTDNKLQNSAGSYLKKQH